MLSCKRNTMTLRHGTKASPEGPANTKTTLPQQPGATRRNPTQHSAPKRFTVDLVRHARRDPMQTQHDAMQTLYRREGTTAHAV